ncbi:MAG TPA: ComEC/Rec2 family competence protein [Candidatus Limnocylindrales bacterium]|nr:ComEC/Rec2 family competence protein [Candidatus Limnocylindrales bacterium]
MDLRLAPLALGCWAAALTTLHVGMKLGLAIGGAAVFAAAVVGIAARHWRWIVLAALVGLALGALATAARQAGAESVPVRSLVSARASAEVELVITDDPRPARATTGRSVTWVVPARLSAVGDRLRLDERVLVLATDERWRSLLPGQRVTTQVRFGQSRGGDLKAAVLSAGTPPALIGSPAWEQRAAASLRAGLQRACEPLDDRPGGLLPGLVVGDTSRLPPELDQQFRDVGLTHLTAVSGSNVAIVVGMVVFLSGWLRLGPRAKALLATVAVIGFVILVRPSPSVLRAAAMGGVGLLALASGRLRAALPALAATVTVLIVIDPELAGDAGFALSVLATGGLLLLAPRMRDGLRRRGVPGGVAEALAVPAAAQLACAPVVAGLSGSISLVAVPANLLAVPAIAPATLTGVVAAALSPLWPGGAQFVAWVGGWPAWWLVKVAEVGASVPAGSIAWPAGVGGALLLTALVIVLLASVRFPAVRLIIATVAVAAVVTAVPARLLMPGWPPPGWLVVACDVGQGDAIVLRAGHASAVVVDAGPLPGGVDRCLDDLDVEEIPLAFLSHFHLDHIGGIAGLLEHRPGTLILPSFPEPVSGRDAVLRAASLAAVPVIEAGPAGAWQVGDVDLRVLPTTRLGGTRSDANNNSLILSATTGGVSVLLLGDAETEQQALVRVPPVQVLKVAHHGSSYQDSDLLDALRPRVALVSVGAGNDYGHPSESVLARLRANGARVCRTDLDGDIAVARAPAGQPGDLAVVQRRVS